MTNAYLIILLTLFLGANALIIIHKNVPQNNLREYSTANQSAGTSVFAFAFAARWFPGSVFIMWFSLASERGIYAEYLLAYTFGAIIMLRFVGVRVWKLGRHYGLKTQADFIELRYGSRLFKKIFSMITLVFWLPWAILELKTLGHAITASSKYSIEYNISMIIVTIFVIICCFYGGVRGVNNSAVLHAVTSALLGGGCAYYLIRRIFGGIGDMYLAISERMPALLILDLSPPSGFEWASAIISGTFGSVFWPGMFCLIYTAADANVIRAAGAIAPVILAPVIFLVLALGMGAPLIPGFDAEKTADIFQIAESYGGQIILALLGIAVVASSISMCAPVFNVAGVMIAGDLNPARKLSSASNGDDLKIARVATVSVGLLTLWMATLEIPNLVSTVMLMYNFIIHAGVPILLGLFLKRCTLPGAAAGMASGILVTLLAGVSPRIIEMANGCSAGMLGLMVHVVVLIGVSMFTPASKNVEEIFAVCHSPD
jgi:SSS family solute:Na+ symporter